MCVCRYVDMCVLGWMGGYVCIYVLCVGVDGWMDGCVFMCGWWVERWTHLHTNDHQQHHTDQRMIFTNKQPHTNTKQLELVIRLLLQDPTTEWHPAGKRGCFGRRLSFSNVLDRGCFVCVCVYYYLICDTVLFCVHGKQPSMAGFIVSSFARPSSV